MLFTNYEHEYFENWFTKDRQEVAKKVLETGNQEAAITLLEAAFYSGRLKQKYITEVVTGEDGELYINLDVTLLKRLGWEPGTLIEWEDRKDGSWSLKRAESRRSS